MLYILIPNVVNVVKENYSKDPTSKATPEVIPTPMALAP